jgi:hypothetical protein
MTLKDWHLDVNNSFHTIWRNVINPELSFEIHKFDSRDYKELGARYYCFPATDGKGTVSSPDMVMTKKEAVDLAKKYMEAN